MLGTVSLHNHAMKREHSCSPVGPAWHRSATDWHTVAWCTVGHSQWLCLQPRSGDFFKRVGRDPQGGGVNSLSFAGFLQFSQGREGDEGGSGEQGH